MISSLLRRPLLLWGAYLAALTITAVAARAIWPHLASGAAGLSGLQVAVQAFVTLFPLPFVAAVGWRRSGFVKPRHLWLTLFPAATVAFGYLGSWQSLTASRLGLAVALVVLVALGEEMAFRGVVLSALLPLGIGRAVAISSAMFGLTHVVNLALGAALPGVVLQVLFSAMGGAGYAALRIRTGSLWPPVLLHAGYDLAFRVIVIDPGTPFANTFYSLHGVGLLVYAVVVLRRRARPDVAGVSPGATSSPDVAAASGAVA